MNRACLTNTTKRKYSHERSELNLSRESGRAACLPDRRASDLFKTNYPPVVGQVFRMKRTVFISSLVLISCFCSAQTQKGKVLIEAGSNFNSSFAANSYDSGNGQLQKSNNAQFAFQLGIGYFIFDNFVFGLEPMFTYNRTKDESTNNKLTSTNLVIGPMVRYYFGSSGFVWS